MMAMALMRAVEADRPQGVRLFDDPVSRQLLPASWQLLMLPGLKQLLLAYSRWTGPGSLGNLYCRTRCIDDALRQALAEGLDQVVILGAGFDCRPYRIEGIQSTQVYEVDLPATQQLKQERLREALGGLPDHVLYVSTDFNERQLDEVMAEAGYDPAGRTFFIWEGVTQYITRQAMNATFRFVARAAGPGSTIVFTYIHRGIVQGWARSRSDERILDVARRGQSPWITGLDPVEVPAYLADRGLAFVHEWWAPDYCERYLLPMGRDMDIFTGERVVLARVRA
jgi:methyltransferase (TIGR00027 family)